MKVSPIIFRFRRRPLGKIEVWPHRMVICRGWFSRQVIEFSSVADVWVDNGALIVSTPPKRIRIDGLALPEKAAELIRKRAALFSVALDIE